MVQVVSRRFLTSQSRVTFQGKLCGVSVGKVALGRVRVPVIRFAFANYHYRHVPCALVIHGMNNALYRGRSNTKTVSPYYKRIKKID
jgi:hypothetical protein